MIKFLKRVKDRMASRIRTAVSSAAFVFSVLANNRAEGYVDTAVKILISVVIGALLLAGLYALFGDMIMPELHDRIQDMFNYAG